MAVALTEAASAAAKGEVPVGAVVVYEGAILTKAHNLRETTHDPLGHAEVLAIRQAAKLLGRWRLTGCTLVVTLEPCPMCAGAITLARLDKLVFGCTDPRAGAVGSIMNLATDSRLNHRPAVEAGVMAPACSQLLKDFFAARRQSKRPAG